MEQSNNTELFKGLCISSGGMKGLYYLGVLDYYYEKKLLDNVEYYAGTSIGSLICLLLIIGYTPKEIFVYLCKNDFSEHFKVMSFDNLLKEYGLIDTDKLKKYLETMVIEKMGYIPTLLEIFMRFKKYFYCNSYNVNANAKIYFSYKTHPTMLATDAVICSCSIPFLFSKTNIEHNTYVDGAIFEPIPIKIILSHFLEENYKKILTINFKQKNVENSEGLLNYANKIILTMIEKQDIIDLAKKTEYIEIETDILPYEFLLDNNKKISMFLEGKNFIKKRHTIKEKVD